MLLEMAVDTRRRVMLDNRKEEASWEDGSGGRKGTRAEQVTADQR